MSDAPKADLSNFSLNQLGPFVRGSALPATPFDHVLMMVGQDDVHRAFAFILRGVQHELHLNMFGYDDEELNDILWSLVENPNILVHITLDKSQAGGVHEHKLLDADRTRSLADFNTHFAIGQSATHSISHTKGFVADGIVGCHGSTNWSSDGEGTFILKDQPGGPGYKAQNNSQSFFTDARSVRAFRLRLMAEHDIALKQAIKVSV